MLSLRPLPLVLVLTLAACAPKGPPADPASLKPADARLAALYEGSCRACHAVAASGAPLVHDAATWAPRWKQGEAVLLDHVVQGFNGMPAGGQCAACSAEDYKALTRFLAGKETS